jgi:TonB family protein
MKQFLSLVTGSALAATAFAAPAVAAPRQPAKKWVVEFAEAQCLASREYGTAEKPLMLVLKLPPMGEVLQMTLVRSGRTGGTEQVPAEVRIGDHPAIRTSALAWNIKRAPLRSIRINLPDAAADQLAGASVLSVSGPELTETFALAQMGDLMAAMKRCIADLRTYWNIGPENEPKLRARAIGNLARYFDAGDYPDMAIRKEQGGTVQFALLIDETGKIADCTVTATSSVPVLDAQSCIVLTERARFTPAAGTDGKPAKDAVTSRVTWKMH